MTTRPHGGHQRNSSSILACSWIPADAWDPHFTQRRDWRRTEEVVRRRRSSEHSREPASDSRALSIGSIIHTSVAFDMDVAVELKTQILAEHDQHGSWWTITEAGIVALHRFLQREKVELLSATWRLTPKAQRGIRASVPRTRADTEGIPRSGSARRRERLIPLPDGRLRARDDACGGSALRQP